MMGGMQTIKISPSTTKGNTIHEIGHALGLWHEQSRSDRDNYIVVHYDNIKPEFKTNYDKTAGGANGTTYDVGSIMHYPAYSKNFTIDPTQPAITVVPPTSDANMGQRTALSDQDIASVKNRYGLP